MAGPALGGLGFSLSIYNLWSGAWKPAEISLACEPPSFGTQWHIRDGEPPLLLLRLPIVLTNSGARTGVVGALRLDGVPGEWDGVDSEVFAHAICTTIDPRNGGRSRFFEPLSIPGHETLVTVCEFNLNGVAPDAIKSGTYTLSVSAPVEPAGRSDGPRSWRTLGGFRIVINEHERRGFNTDGDAHFNRLRSSTPGTGLRTRPTPAEAQQGE